MLRVNGVGATAGAPAGSAGSLSGSLLKAYSGYRRGITGVSLGDQTGGYKIQVSTSRSVEGVDRPWDAQRLIGGG